MTSSLEPSGSNSKSLSSKKRRLLSRSDEEVVEEMDMELYYRQGWPTLSVLPLDTELGAGKYFGDYYEVHLPVINLILESQRIEKSFISSCHRVHHGCEPDELTATLLVVAKVGAGSWFHAIKDIRKYLAKQALDVNIEFIDTRAYPSLPTFTILPSESEIITFWSEIRERVITILKSSGQPWSVVDVFHRGLGETRQECPPTVMISSPNPSDAAWKRDIIPAIRQICIPHLYVELLYGHFITCFDERDSEKAGRVLTIEAFGGILLMGNGCGPRGGGSSGTLGGTVALRRGEHYLGTFALTNSHVVRSQPYNDAILGNRAFYPHHPLAQNQSLVVRAPSDSDLKIRLKVNDQMIENCRRSIDGFDGDLENDEPPRFSLRLKVEMGETSKIPLLERREKQKQELEQESKTMEEFDRDIGSVYAGSGYRTASFQAYSPDYQYWGLDWALIRLGSRQMYNTIEVTAQETNCPFHLGLSANAWGKAKSSTQVAKRGRTTGWTVGELNAIGSIMISPKYGREVTCLPVKGKKGPFADPGDSGAVVLEVPEGKQPDELKWIGLLFAAAEANDFGYVLPIDLVMKDIKEVTGCDVVEPVTV